MTLEGGKSKSKGVKWQQRPSKWTLLLLLRISWIYGSINNFWSFVKPQLVHFLVFYGLLSMTSLSNSLASRFFSVFFTLCSRFSLLWFLFFFVLFWCSLRSKEIRCSIGEANPLLSGPQISFMPDQRAVNDILARAMHDGIELYFARGR